MSTDQALKGDTAASDKHPHAATDERLRSKTGRGLQEWFGLLDTWGAKEAGHAATARFLGDQQGLEDWWAQTVTVAYELDRGLRRPGERADGTFEITVRRTVPASAERTFAAVSRAEEWNKWFTTGAKIDLVAGGSYADNDGDRGTVLVVSSPDMLRMTWENPDHGAPSVVDFQVDPRGPQRALIEISHEKIASEEAYKSLKPGWQWAMDSLKQYLTDGAGIPENEWRMRKKGK